ncbi:hypothetical protein SCB71_07090 [Herbiconiux sp. KACC 21604]|uniref:hypothetical protein n=1 Tax=unclassified Herbiconiux TaxID=2618217 RepID=UPI001492E7AA|nr:hypothetical protein [Herbiconiux sp. SALV-R1]QJU53065.1 hypothetical protein HL652_05070 [Herbiconiux sp. SALV-R1]WPO87999.1 hypothetical protein SCB71_07090 [Herbiconiux sp. KACC 21604]
MTNGDGGSKNGKPERDPGDPGFWRRPLSGRVVWILIAAAALVIVAAIVVSTSLGVKLF